MQISWTRFGPDESPNPSDYDSDAAPVVNEAEVRRFRQRRQQEREGSPVRECLDSEGNVLRLRNLRISDAFNSDPERWLRPARRITARAPSVRGNRGRTRSIAASTGRVVENRYGSLEQTDPSAASSESEGPGL